MTENLAVPKSEEEAAETRAKLVTSKTAWKKNRVHKGVVCPSGAVISVQIPNLTTLAASGEIPNELVDIAAAVTQTLAAGKPVPEDSMEKMQELERYLVLHTVAEPKITKEDIDDLPAEDVSFIGELAFRQRDTDALGNSIAGLDALAKYATFRDLNAGNEDFLDA